MPLKFLMMEFRNSQHLGGFRVSPVMNKVKLFQRGRKVFHELRAVVREHMSDLVGIHLHDEKEEMSKCL